MSDRTLIYHLMHPGPSAMPGDPNPAFCIEGVYHLHYIYNDARGFCSAHVSSADLLSWKWHKTVRQPSFTVQPAHSRRGWEADQQ